MVKWTGVSKRGESKHRKRMMKRKFPCWITRDTDIYNIYHELAILIYCLVWEHSRAGRALLAKLYNSAADDPADPQMLVWGAIHVLNPPLLLLELRF